MKFFSETVATFTVLEHTYEADVLGFFEVAAEHAQHALDAGLVYIEDLFVGDSTVLASSEGNQPPSASQSPAEAV